MTPAISIKALSKRYELGLTHYGSARDLVNSWAARIRGTRNRSEPERTARCEENDFVWALKDLSLDVEPGEALGIIGRNGAGKSTLLKILSNITKPTKGTVELRGRVASLLEVGTGFHPELTGRENVYMNGTILGMSKSEIRREFDSIVDFAGLEKFIDTPVKRYSSGMTVRLGFAVAAHLTPEILIVDEVLAVGDVEFQRKCLGKMDDAVRSGRTVLFVSHNLASIGQLTSRCILLDFGQLTFEGPTDRALIKYLDESKSPTLGDSDLTSVPRPTWLEPGEVQLISAELLESRLSLGRPVQVNIDAAIPNSLQVRIGITIVDRSGSPVGAGFSDILSRADTGDDWKQEVQFTVSNPNLVPGRYSLTIALICESGRVQDAVENALSFEVEEGAFLTHGINEWKSTIGSIQLKVEQTDGS